MAKIEMKPYADMTPQRIKNQKNETMITDESVHKKNDGTKDQERDKDGKFFDPSQWFRNSVPNSKSNLPFYKTIQASTRPF